MPLNSTLLDNQNLPNPNLNINLTKTAGKRKKEVYIFNSGIPFII